MDSLLIDLVLSGIAYVVIIFMVITFTKVKLKRGKNSDDDEDGGIILDIPPTIDLPPGVLWSDDSPKDKPIRPQEVEF